MFRSDITNEVSHFRKCGEFAIKVPWPFWNRSINLAVSAMPVREGGAIIITMKSLNTGEWFGHKVEAMENCEECNVHFCSAYIETISEN